ncbi:MAG: metallophosphoesterase [Candidatus Bathyarchaeia archaeon]
MKVSHRIVHISDTHISPHGQFLDSYFDKAVEKINKLDPPPSLIIHTGDLTDNGVLLDYELALEKLKSFHKKILISPGNHDERNYGQSLFRELISSMDREVKFDDIVVYLMNSPEPDRDAGRLGRRRLEFLENKLKRISDETIKIVVFHHHLIPVAGSGREMNVLEDAGDVLEAVLRHHVNLVLMGHRHVRRVLRIESSILLNAGTVSSIRTRGRFGHSFNIIDIYQDGSISIIERNLSLEKDILLANYRKQ